MRALDDPVKLARAAGIVRGALRRQAGRAGFWPLDEDLAAALDRAARDESRDTDEFVYFARFPTTIKIGYSRNPQERVRQLGGELLAVTFGNRETERKLHERFRRIRRFSETANANGGSEHFEPGAALFSLIDRVLWGERLGSILP